MNKKIFFLSFFILILVFSLTSFANQDYTQTGFANSTYKTGRSQFNTLNVQTSLTGSRAISTPYETPKVADLDGDGVNEIVVVDGTNIRLYQNKELDIVDAFVSTNITGQTYSIIFDIDGDGKKEILITSDDSLAIDIIEYNGSDIFLDYTMPINGSTHVNGQVMLACKDVDECIYVTALREDTINPNWLYVTHFNTGGTTKTTGIRSSTDLFCLPRVPSIAVVDYDNDGTKEYVFSAVRKDAVGAFGNGQVELYYIDASATSVTLEHSVQGINTVDTGGSSPTTCTANNYDGRISSPLVTDLDGANGNGLETAVAYMISDDDHKIEVFDSIGTSLKTHPAVFNGEGILVSNLVSATAFANGDGKDYCVVGHKSSANRLALTCGTLTGSSFFGTIFTEEYFYDLPNGFHNVSNTYQNYHSIIHSGQHVVNDVNEVSGSTYISDLSEFITSQGVFKINPNYLGTDNDLDLIFDFPTTEGAIIPVDVEKTGQLDMLALTNTNLAYIDDGFSNTAGQITGYRIDPCVDAIWKTNTSVEVRITVDDVNDDDISSRAFLYYGGSNQQDTGWSTNNTHGTTYTFNFVANTTGANQILRMQGRDVENGQENDTIDRSFSVSSTGTIEKGDCITEVNIDLTDEVVDVNETLTGLNETNAIKSTLIAFRDVTGLSFSILWLLGMVIMGFVAIFGYSEAIQKGESNANGFYIFLAVALIESIMLIIGVLVGALSVGILIAIIVMAIILLGLWLGTIMTSSRNIG